MSKNDVIRLACERAAHACDKQYQNKFNAANFSQQFINMSPTSEQIDGHLVRLMLTGRNDIEILGDDYYRLIKR